MSRRNVPTLELTVLAVSLLCIPGTGCRKHDDHAQPGVRVMTQNVYTGFDVDPLLAAEDPAVIPLLVAQAYEQLISTDFVSRAEAMADEIARTRPHLVGLQEVALIRIQTPGDAAGGGTVPAETVLFDHLGILMTALEARGLDYVVAGQGVNVDVELPMLTGIDPPSFDDLRLTDHDVILARGDVDVTNVEAATYEAALFVPALALEIPRGYVALDARLPSGRRFRFATTHLEDLPFTDVQLAQAEELTIALDGATDPVLLVGDFNSPATEGETYRFLAGRGYVDVWTLDRRPAKGDGLTWGHDPDLRNEEVAFSMRIDQIWMRRDHGTAGVAWTDVWGDELHERTEDGLWPSDHAGVSARILPLTDRE